ncbi:MAG: hypothetical protein D6800_12480 [Candidatus Zixiibacteriota bacterium]|nr:MAG: hypothetical protein D6800_12480 [candidate division Zixibacteria bacterium]
MLIGPPMSWGEMVSLAGNFQRNYIIVKDLVAREIPAGTVFAISAPAVGSAGFWRKFCVARQGRLYVPLVYME